MGHLPVSLSDAPKQKTRGRFWKVFSALLCMLLVGGGVFFQMASNWYLRTFGDIGFDAILFTLMSGVDGTSRELLRDFVLFAVLPTVPIAAAILFVLLFRPKKHLLLRGQRRTFGLYPLRRGVALGFSALLFLGLFYSAAHRIRLDEFLSHSQETGAFYEEEYIDPDTVEITFPEKKRNLIYLYLESMETTFLSTQQGGAMDTCRIPELYTLACDNVNFSHTTGVGGCRQISGASWTIGAMVAHTAGIPLMMPEGLAYEEWEHFLPGVTGLGDILHKNGYRQALLVGSDSTFGGRNHYYLQHGTDQIYDYNTAIEDGLIPEDYYVWWGMEDLHLYDYAKQILPDLAASDQPFALTMLTVDTHHIGGYECALCPDRYEESYENVYACASCQVGAFVSWLQEQPFFENTTLVITGDHLSMDAAYFDRNTGDFDRRIYNCFLGADAVPAAEKKREFSQFDMFPSTLAALGCTIQGNQLGFGVNLFSKVPTLTERYGYEEFKQMLKDRSTYYNDHFVLESEEEPSP